MELKSQLMELPFHRTLKSDAIPSIFPLHFKEEGIRSVQQKRGQAESQIPSTSAEASTSSSAPGSSVEAVGAEESVGEACPTGCGVKK
ncbi:hypothetical protein J4Q44_G00086030 [Coregonus suidteri]|uniref:Uncharacterized protein n=1 Tax=Coregonus suidteri TaxID=861788 RepID=A0AAN8M8X1_9TELE